MLKASTAIGEKISEIEEDSSAVGQGVYMKKKGTKVLGALLKFKLKVRKS